MKKLPSGHYTNRQERARFIAANFGPYLSGWTLDVGCGDAWLREHLSHYIGLDIGGQPDVWVNLERGGLPLADRAVEASVCTDVLEHVEPLAAVLAELFRVSKKHVVISLPNMYALGWRLKFLRGQVISKEYSLTPQNRHKWLVNLAEASRFMNQQLPPNWRIKWEFGYYPGGWWRVGPLYRGLAWRYPNLFATSYWALFEHSPQ